MRSYKQTKAFFLSEPEVLSCFELNYKFLERYKKPLSLATTRKQENTVNTAQKMQSQSSTEATTDEVPGSIVTYTEEEINTFKDDVASENTKKSTPLAIVLNRGTQKYKKEENLNSISKTFQSTYLVSIAMLNFQCFRLDTSFLSILPPKM